MDDRLGNWTFRIIFEREQRDNRPFEASVSFVNSAFSRLLAEMDGISFDRAPRKEK